MRRYYFK